jgi:AraC-like DNA-binding protein
MEQNICYFVPFHKSTHSIHIINFVLETKPQVYASLKSESVYKMYYVCSGQGFIHTPGKITPLTQGDLFFTFPAASFAIESKENFTYMYISFVGLRGNSIMQSLNVSSNNFVFHQANEVQDFWQKGILAGPKMMELMSESVLLYTFAFLGDKLLLDNNRTKQHPSVDLIKKYLDDHYTDHNLSLEDMRRELSYNKKYISHVFKKHFGIGIVEYLNTVRIQNACTMIAQGYTSVNDIAERCGYSDAQYFSKIFKTKMGIAPTQYIKKVHNDKK